MFVQDAMLPNPLTVTPETSVVDFVCAVLASNQTTGVVIGDGDRVLGVVSVLDVFRRILPSYVDLRRDLANVFHDSFFDEEFAILRTVPVSTIMITEVITLAPKDAIMRAVQIFVYDRYKTIPVVESGRYVGSVTRRSVLRRVTADTE